MDTLPPDENLFISGSIFFNESGDSEFMTHMTCGQVFYSYILKKKKSFDLVGFKPGKLVFWSDHVTQRPLRWHLYLNTPYIHKDFYSYLNFAQSFEIFLFPFI